MFRWFSIDKADTGSLWDSFAEVESSQCIVCGRSVDNWDSRLETGYDEISCHPMDVVGPSYSKRHPLVGEDHGDAVMDVQLRRPKKTQ